MVSVSLSVLASLSDGLLSVSLIDTFLHMLILLYCNNQETNNTILEAECSLISLKYQDSIIDMALFRQNFNGKVRNIALEDRALG